MEEWEEISYETTRLRVYDGWIVQVSTHNGVGLTFVPDVQKFWYLESDLTEEELSPESVKER